MVHIPDAFSSLFAGGRIAILDIPSGAGAFALSLLCTLAELRASCVIPRLPLDVVVIGGEFNPHATDYALELYRQVRDELDSQAITIEFKPFQWDVSDKLSTTGMVRQFVADAPVLLNGAEVSSRILDLAAIRTIAEQPVRRACWFSNQPMSTDSSDESAACAEAGQCTRGRSNSD